MIITEDIGNGLVRTYSDAGFMIHGGYPEADYIEAIDPISTGRTYTETDRPIPEPEQEPEPTPEDAATADDYEAALAALGVE